MDYAFHLVLVSGTAVPRLENDRDPKTFFTQRFPKSLIDEFLFMDSSADSERLLYQRSTVLLEQLHNSRGSSTLPIVFLAHGLGGFVVKQTLISATEEPRYRDIALHTSTILFFGASHRATPQMSWEHLYLRLLSASGSLPPHPLKLVQRLVEELEGVSASFRTISCSFDVVNFYEAGPHPLLDQRCSTLGRQDEINIGFDGRHEELWNFVSGDGKTIADKACKHILATKNGRNFLLRDFLHRLSLLDSQTHRLKPNFGAPISLDWVRSTEEFKSWRSDALVGLLRISGPSGSGTTAIAAQILGTLLDQTDQQDIVCVSFAFDKNNIRACTPFSFYLSLCRQILSSRPRLFQHVSPVSNFLTQNGLFTAETFCVMVQCLMRHLLDNQEVSVYCVIDAVDECIIFQSELIRRMEELVKLANHRFKLLLSGIKLPAPILETSHYREIILESSSEGMVSSKRQYVRDRIHELALENSAWHGLEDVALTQLSSLPADSPYLLAKLNMLLLEWTGRHSTKSDLKDKLRQQATTLDDYYAQVVAVIDGANRGWVVMALHWIVSAVRPLRPTELAVAVALDDIPGGHPWKREELDNFSNSIRRDIIGDLKHFMAPLIKVEDNRVYLIHDTFRLFLQNTFNKAVPQTPASSPKDDSTQEMPAKDESEQDEPTQQRSASDDVHYGILFNCLEYLKIFGENGSASIVCEDGTRCYLPTDREFGLLSYATLHWSQHFSKAASAFKSAAHNLVLQFVQDDKRVQSWESLYHQLKPSLKSNVIHLDDPLKVVCNFGLVELIDDCINILKSREDFDDRMRKSLDLAAQNGHNNVVQRLLQKDVRSSEALGLAAAGGFEAVVESLLAVGSDIDKPDQTRYAPLHHATCGGHKHIVSLLLTKSAEPNVLTLPPPNLQSPTSRRRRRIRRRRYSSLDSDSDSDSDLDETKTSLPEIETVLSGLLWSETSLQLAALTGQHEIAKLLLTQGADANKETSAGYDPLMYAAIGGFPELVTLLLQPNADGGYHVDGDKASDSDGNTALHLAAAYGHHKAAELLLQNSSDAAKLIHTRNIRGLSPIHLAAREGHLSLLNLMLDIEDMSRDVESIASDDRNDRHKSSTPPTPVGNLLSTRLPDLRRPTRRTTIEVSPERKSQPSSSNPPPLTMSKDHQKSALEWAAENGHRDIVRVLARKDRRKPEELAFALCLAAQNGHTSIVSVLLDDNSTKAATDARQNTALHLAAKGGHSETLVELLTHSRGASMFRIDATEKRGMTALHLAAQGGHKEIVESLLQRKAKTNLADKRSMTALHFAAKKGHLPCVEAVLRLEYGADPKLVNKQGKTALHHAAQNGYLMVVKRLCEIKEIIWMEDENHSSAFDLVVGRNDIKEVEEFLQILDNTTEDEADFIRGGSPLHVVARHQNMDILRLLLDKGWKCDAKDDEGATPLHIAVGREFLQGIEVLLQNPQCDILAQDNDGSTVIHYANTPEMVNILLEAGAKNDLKDNRKRTPLYRATYRGNLDLVQALLNTKPKPDVHTKDDDDWTLLHAAYDSPYITELLLTYDVKPNALNDAGRTPLALTIRWNHPKTAKLLLEAGANPNLARNFKNSPLYLAFERGDSLELIKLLVENKPPANILEKDSEGNTALHIAAQKDKRPEVEYLVEKLGHIKTSEITDIYASVLCEYAIRSYFKPELAEILVSRGLNVNRITEPHFTALHAACSKGNIDAVKWLLEKKASVNMLGGKYGSPLCAAVESEKDAEEKVRLLLDEGADIDFFAEKTQPTALQRATSQPNTTLINLLLSKGANVNLTGGDLDTPLNAAILGRVGLTTINTMLENGADTSKPGKGGQLPIHAAAKNDRDDILRAMILAKANPLSRDSDGRSALMHGVVKRNLDVVNCLLVLNAFDPDEVDAKHQTPLIVATVLGSYSIVSMLLEVGHISPEILDAQDYEGKTALAHATSLDHLEIVRKLLDSEADPRIVDCRGRSPLYWAARAARMRTLDIIIAALVECDGHITKHWDIAVHGAVASTKQQALVRLLEREDVDVEHPGPDGWTPLYTARRYQSYRMEDLLQEEAGITSLFDLHLERLSGWHSKDRFPGLDLNSDGTTLSTIGGTKFKNLGHSETNYGAVRTDYPMLPLFKDKVFYFEIKITKAAKGYLVVGFCDDKAPLHRMLGWDAGSWGFHSDDGCLYEDGKQSWKGILYSDPYTGGEVIGCGVNFAENTAFYTRGGKVVGDTVTEAKIIGRAFQDIRGKLYPAVSMDITQEGWEITAVFPGKDGTSPDFIFQGDLESSETLAPPVKKDDSSTSDDADSGSEIVVIED